MPPPVFQNKQKGMLSRLKYRFLLSIFLCISILMSFQSCQEEFVDEETGEKILLDRYDVLDGATFTTSTDELYKLIEGIDSFTDEDVSLLNSSILQGNHRVSEHLYDKHRNAGFALTLAENYYYGAEEQGIFIDKEKARYYYDLAGEDMPEMEEDDDLSDIYTVTFTINGDKQQIGQIAELIKNLATRMTITATLLVALSGVLIGDGCM